MNLEETTETSGLDPARAYGAVAESAQGGRFTGMPSSNASGEQACPTLVAGMRGKGGERLHQRIMVCNP